MCNTVVNAVRAWVSKRPPLQYLEQVGAASLCNDQEHIMLHCVIGYIYRKTLGHQKKMEKVCQCR